MCLGLTIVGERKLSTGICRHDSCSTLRCTCSWCKAGTDLLEHEWRTTERKVGERKVGLRKLRSYRSAIAAAEVLHLDSFVFIHSPLAPTWRCRVYVPVPNWSNVRKTSICVGRWSQDGVNWWLCHQRWHFCRDRLRKLVNVGEIVWTA
jgi:hypothetical protein